MPIDFHRRRCPICGPDHPGALKLDGRPVGDDGAIAGELTFDERHEGGPGLAHGAMIAAVFDEVLGCCLELTRQMAVTAKLDVEYLRPTPLGRELRFEAAIERREGRRIITRGRLRDGEQVLACGCGVFVAVEFDHFIANGGPDSERVVADLRERS